jgi:hypothetical protein
MHKPKQYRVTFTVVIHDKATTYPEIRPVDLSVIENLPANVDAHRYVRSRIAEELSRSFGSVSVPIENKTEGAMEEDPLAA